MNIPDEAVRAALTGWEDDTEIHHGCFCGDDEFQLRGCEDRMREALEAALPHLVDEPLTVETLTPEVSMQFGADYHRTPRGAKPVFLSNVIERGWRITPPPEAVQ